MQKSETSPYKGFLLHTFPKHMLKACCVFRASMDSIARVANSWKGYILVTTPSDTDVSLFWVHVYCFGYQEEHACSSFPVVVVSTAWPCVDRQASLRLFLIRVSQVESHMQRDVGLQTKVLRCLQPEGAGCWLGPRLCGHIGSDGNPL